MQTSDTDRRPLASRSTRWAGAVSRWLAGTSVTPNQISIFSMVVAAAGMGAMVLSVQTPSRTLAGALLLLAACACQLRLLCNLMDGMVAIEAGKQTRDGAVWNELPDRVADMALLAGLGVASGFAALGWMAAALAVFVAYVRELGKGVDGVVDFAGPMAKPHRMALVTVALVVAALFDLVSESLSSQVDSLLQGALWLLCAGCVVTLHRRTASLLHRLNRDAD